MATVTPPVYISRLRVKNFRSLVDVDIALDPLTVLVGPNASGKSNIVDALAFVRDSLRGLEEAVLDRGGPQAIRVARHGGRPRHPAFDIDFRHGDGQSSHYHFKISVLKDRPPSVIVEEFSTSANRIDDGWFHRRDSKVLARISSDDTETAFEIPDHLLVLPWLAPSLGSIASAILEALRSIGNFRFEPRLIAQPQSLYDAPLLDSASNLPSVLRSTTIGNGTEYSSRLVAAVGRLVPGVDSIAVEVVGGHLVVKLGHDGPRVAKRPLSLESEGTIRGLAILAALYQPHRPALSIFEEPETGLHVGAMGVLADELIAASRTSQVLITTHSADLLDLMPPESIRVVEMVDGETRVAGVASEQIKSVHQKLFHPGELHRIEGLRREA